MEQGTSDRSANDVAVFAAARRAKSLSAFAHACETGSVPNPLFIPLLDGGSMTRLRTIVYAVIGNLHLARPPPTSLGEVQEHQDDKETEIDAPVMKKDDASTLLLTILPFLSFTILSARKRARVDERAPTPPPPFHFFVRPPFNTSTSVFVRMRSEKAIHEDELNRYFGRYGQIRATHITDGLDVAAQFPSTDYIVTVDSANNALAAVTEIEHPDVLFVALSDPLRNNCSRDDIPNMILQGNHGADVLAVTIAGHPHFGIAGEGEGDEFGTGDDGGAMVPDIVVVGLPVWVTPDQLAEYFLPFGAIDEVRFAIDDRSGAFCGAALVRMASSASAVRAAAAIHGRSVVGATVSCGVVDPDGNLTNLLTGEVLVAAGPVPSKTPRSTAAPMDALTRLWL